MVNTSNRTSHSITIMALLLLAVNFAFDWWRRYDFEEERERLDNELTEVSETIDRARLLLGRVDRGREELGARFQEIDEQLAFLQLALDEIEPIDARRNSGSYALSDRERTNEQGGRPNPGALHTSLDGLERVLQASLDSLQEEFDSLAEKPSVFQRFQRLPGDPKEWNVDQLVKNFEDEFRYALGPDERKVLKMRIESFRQASVSALSQYMMGLNSEMADRIFDGDYDSPDPHTGEFRDLEPSADPLAIVVTGKKRFVWDKARYPELHRLNLLHQYIPAVMLEQTYTFFNERSGR